MHLFPFTVDNRHTSLMATYQEILDLLFLEAQSLGVCVNSGHVSRSWVKAAFLFVQFFVSPILDIPLGKYPLLNPKDRPVYLCVGVIHLLCNFYC